MTEDNTKNCMMTYIKALNLGYIDIDKLAEALEQDVTLFTLFNANRHILPIFEPIDRRSKYAVP